MRPLLNDLSFALRQFRKTPVFAITILAVLAMGVGATTAIFTLFDQVLLRSLPVHRPQELVRLQTTGSFSGRFSSHGGDDGEYMSYPAYHYLRDNNPVFSGVIASDGGLNVGIRDEAEPVPAELVSGNYFQVLGVAAAAGRLIQPADDHAKLGSPVLVLSYGYWQRKFSGDPRIIGKVLQINGHDFTMIGVAARGFHSVDNGNTPSVFFPMMMKPVITPDWDDLDNRKSIWLNVVARLKPGVTRAQAEAAMQPVWHAERVDDFAFQEDRSENSRKGYIDKSRLKLLNGATGFSPLRDTLDTPVKVLMGMAALLLLMACANVASLLLVRTAGRVREMSVRYALGAKRRRILQQLLVEGLLLGLLGGALGLLLAQPVAELLIRRIQGLSPGEAPYSPHLDLRLLLITVAITLTTTLLFSLAPAIQFWRPNLMPALKQQTVTASGTSLLLRRISVGVQIALSVLLLASAGLFLRTVRNLRSTDLGFQPDHIVQFGVDPRLAGYPTDQVFALDQQILDSLRGLPGVRAVGATDDAEMMGNHEMNGIEIPGYKPSQSNEMDTEWSDIDPGYFAALGTHLVAGRNFADSDREHAQHVMIVSRNFATHFFGSEQKALGHTIKGPEKAPLLIVGVVDDIRHGTPREALARRAFVPYLQRLPGQLTFVLRTTAAPASMMETIRQVMHQVDPKLALDTMETMDMQLDQSLSQERTLALLATSFGVLAALMSAVGLYGVLAFDTMQRTREIGVRMALGASRPAVARLLLQETLRLTGVSIAVALPLAWGFAHLAKSLLYGVQSADPITYIAVALLVAVVALVAAAIPTWRAASIEPMRALRYE